MKNTDANARNPSPSAPSGTTKRVAQKTADRVFVSCTCHGLGAYVCQKSPPANPSYEVRACADHCLRIDAKNGIDAIDAAATRVDECLEAIASVRDILWPGGSSDGSWSPDTIEAIGRRLVFLAPRGAR